LSDKLLFENVVIIVCISVVITGEEVDGIPRQKADYGRNPDKFE
jgi:hypothetical protein